ncbi:hypothetical protein [Falsirhodobacter sp. 20TX0035]|uniref:hypothetical protein n=1 Tax=Falsirhodobacter sp. 20TX0035 TaxID=3022019 RepID=UPI00232F8E0F|nr:hypothetical protein [Falsirhodobacter sp. 20TX0035]MDB6454679.1 hypothetical protein [Falsirhodobacter sp. 20TX0035]
MTAQTGAGVSLAISLAAPASYDADGFGALQPVTIGEVTNIGSFGREFSTVTHQALDRRGTDKRKGAFNNGAVSPTLALDPSDAGQDAVEAAKERRSPAFFRVTLQDGLVYWFAGVVMSFRVRVNGADDVVIGTISIEIEPTPIVRYRTVAGLPGDTFLTIEDLFDATMRRLSETLSAAA